jgi:Winged helix DNA-binding domain
MAVRRIDAAERRSRLAVRHRLVAAARTDSVEEITASLVALHSTDPVTVYLSAAARMAHPSLATVDAALYERRSLLRHHAMRRTLWIFGHEPARLAHHGATLGVARAERRKLLGYLEAGGIAGPEPWLKAAMTDVGGLLTEAGPLTAREIGVRLPALAVPVLIGGGKYAVTQPAHSRVLLQMGFEGQILRTRPTGTWINGQYRYAAVGAWFPGGFGELDVREAAAGLARLWLAAFGPGTRTDLRWWAGWTVATTTKALADVGAVEVDLDEGTGYVLPDDVDAPEPAPPSATLLPGLDPSTMGWKQRGFHLDPADVPVLFDRNGNGGPTAWVDGRIVGGWHHRKDGTVALHLTREVGAEAREALAERAAMIEQLLGEVRFTVRFPSPVLATLGGNPG